MARAFKFYQQLESMDCGPACIKMVAAHYGAHYRLSYLKESSDFGKSGTNFLSIKQCFEKLGFRVTAATIPFRTIDGLPGLEAAPLPCIVHWRGNHFVVVYEITDSHVRIADPAQGKLKLSTQEFRERWIDSGAGQADATGSALIVIPGDQLQTPPEIIEQNRVLAFLMPYLRRYRTNIFWILAGVLVISGLQYVFPILNQHLVDDGIIGKNVRFVKLVLLGMLCFFMGRITIEIVQNWLVLNLGTSMNNSMVYNFLKKVLSLPIDFFDQRTKGDFLQRLHEFSRIEQFVTNQLLNSAISVLLLLIFGIVLFNYSTTIFIVFVVSTILYIAWVLLFIKKRTVLDYKLFSKLSLQQNNVYELLEGIRDIKINNLEQSKYEHWKKEQDDLFLVQKSNFRLAQLQKSGAAILSQFKDIIITFYAANAVIRGELSFGMMLSVQYIMGQLNVPIMQVITFIQESQNSFNSIRRIDDIFLKTGEPGAGTAAERSVAAGLMNQDIAFEDVSFGYGENRSILNRINLVIPAGKTTAVVGSSGSGKSTFLNLLMRFYEPDEGRITAGGMPAAQLALTDWRSNCAAVLQEGYLFSETLRYNITLADKAGDEARLEKVIRMARCESIVAELPMGLDTKVGGNGAQLSHGQIQRLLIARALYKDAPLIILDEATNALDTINESLILANMKTHLKGRTAVIVAHRLSTIKEADKIIVFDRGYVAEQGTHDSLMELDGIYAALVDAQIHH
jgi:ATP-binding cassette subfamily B protein